MSAKYRVPQDRTLAESYASFVNSDDYCFEIIEENRLAATIAAGALMFTGLAVGTAEWVNNITSSGISAPRDNGDNLDLYGNPITTDAENLIMPVAPSVAPPQRNILVRAVRREEAVAEIPAQFRQDWAYLTVTVWGEARGEGAEGMQAVASVMKNRLREGRWGQTIQSVVTANRQGRNGTVYQFSCWGDTNKRSMMRMFERDRNLTQLLSTDPEGYAREKARLERSEDWQAWVKAKDIAYKVLKGELRDNSGAANHYHTRAVDPSWNDKMRETARVGYHIFFSGR